LHGNYKIERVHVLLGPSRVQRSFSIVKYRMQASLPLKSLLFFVTANTTRKRTTTTTTAARRLSRAPSRFTRTIRSARAARAFS
jgi:hypothetical protein